MCRVPVSQCEKALPYLKELAIFDGLEVIFTI